MGIDQIKQQIPDFAKDLRINLGNVLDAEQQDGLDHRQIWAIALATAIASRNPVLTAAVTHDAQKILDAQWLSGARAAAAIMSMNNIYYRFVHLAGNDEYNKLPARLRMSVIGNPGIPKEDFELISLAVSAVNGCGLCIDSHERVLKQAGVGSDAIQNAVRIGAVIHAVALVLESEHSVQAMAA